MDDEVYKVSEEMAPPNLSPLSLLLKVEKVGGAALPSFIFTTGSIAELCHREDIPRFIHVSMLIKFECVLECPSGLVINQIGLKFSRIAQWFGYSDEVNVTIATPERL